LLHKLPIGPVLLAPMLLFIELLVFSFLIHWVITKVVIKFAAPHA
jgi:hypothetical protein